MSFSSDVKQELSCQIGNAMHCRIAELTAFFYMNGTIIENNDENVSIKIHTENLSVARKYFTLLKKAYNIESDICVRSHMQPKKNRTYAIEIHREHDAHRILDAVKWTKDRGIIDPLIVQKTCCKRAYLRGAFLCSGSISEPSKTYHFEIVCTSVEQAEQLCTIMSSFGIDGKWILRKKYYVVYIKESSQISDMLNIMGAHVSLMEFENIRILKDMRNLVNRRVNCETANISKTVSAAVKQIEDITYIRDTIGLDELKEGLKEIAVLRLEYPEASLVELGKLLETPVGKSGVNHRLRKLSVLADELRENTNWKG